MRRSRTSDAGRGILFSQMASDADRESRKKLFDPSTVNLRNSAWQAGVRVEAHKGMNQDPDQNPSLGIQMIPYDEAWQIISDVNVQWRREVDPDQPQGQWTQWNDVPVYVDPNVYNIDV